MTRSGAACGHEGYFHETAFYGSDEDLLGVVVPFLRGGQEAGEPTLVTLNARNAALVRGTMDDLEGIDFVPGSVQYRNPSQTIADYRRRFRTLADAGAAQIRVVGDVPHPGTGGCWHAWSRYEAAVNHAYAEFPLWGMCPYDTRLTDDDVLLDVQRTHPNIATADGGHHHNRDFADPDAVLASVVAPLPLPLQRRAPDATARDLSPADARALVTRTVAGALTGEALENLTLAVTEIVTNAIRYGEPPADLAVWAEPGRAVVTVHDRGPGPTDPFAGLMPRDAELHRHSMGVGLWLAFQVCTDVALDHRDGFTVRLLVEA